MSPQSPGPVRVLLLHGPNLNLLGARDETHYGTQTLAQIDARMKARAEASGATLDARQSNDEGELVGWVQAAAFCADVDERFDAVVLNPGGYAHTSVALRDAVEAAVHRGVVVIEVHLSNVHGREPFREHLVTGAVADGIISGLGRLSYELGLDAALEVVRGRRGG